MSWLYKRHIALKLVDIVISDSVQNVKMDGWSGNKDEETAALTLLTKKEIINKEQKEKVVGLIEKCIERPKPLSKSNKKRKLNSSSSGSTLTTTTTTTTTTPSSQKQPANAQLCLLMPRLVHALTEWIIDIFVLHSKIPNLKQEKKKIKIKKNLNEWCGELSQKFPVNKYIPSVMASGFYLNFMISPSEFLQLQLYYIPFIFSKDKTYFKKLGSRNEGSLPSEILNLTPTKNILLYFTPVSLGDSLAPPFSSGQVTEAMSNHLKSLILSNFISCLTHSTTINTITPKLNSISGYGEHYPTSKTIFFTKFIEDTTILAKLIYGNEKYNSKLNDYLNNLNHDKTNNMKDDDDDSIYEEIYRIYHLVNTELKDKKIKDQENEITKEINDIIQDLEVKKDYYFTTGDLSIQKSKDIKDLSHQHHRKMLIQLLQKTLSTRHFKGMEKFIYHPSQPENKVEKGRNRDSLEMIQELHFENKDDLEFLPFLGTNNNSAMSTSSSWHTPLIKCIFGRLWQNKLIKRGSDGKEIELLPLTPNKDEVVVDSIMIQGEKVLDYIYKTNEEVYIDLTSIAMESLPKSNKNSQALKSIKQGKAFLKASQGSKDKMMENEINNKKIQMTELFSDLIIIINRLFSINQENVIEKKASIDKVIFIGNINKDHQYMQLICLLEWIQHTLQQSEKEIPIPTQTTPSLSWDFIGHGRVHGLWDFTKMEALESKHKKYDLNHLLEASKKEMLEVMESNIDKYEELEKELNETDDEKIFKEYTYVKDLRDIVEVSGRSSVILQNLQWRRMKNYEYEWMSSVSSKMDEADDEDDFDDFDEKKKSNVGLYLQYTHAKICGILRNCELAMNQKEIDDMYKTIAGDTNFDETTDILQYLENLIPSKEDTQAIDMPKSISNYFDFKEMVRITPEVFQLVWLLDDYTMNIYPNVKAKLEPSLIVDYLNHLAHCISSASSNLRVKGLGEAKGSFQESKKRKRETTEDQNKGSSPTNSNDSSSYWKKLANTRLLLFYQIRKTLEHGLKILGVQPLDRM